MNRGLALDHKLTALQTGIHDRDGLIHRQKKLSFRIAMVQPDGSLIRAD